MLKLLRLFLTESGRQRLIDAVSNFFGELALKEHPGSARVIICVPTRPDTSDTERNLERDRILEAIAVFLNGIGSCSEVEASSTEERYSVFGESLDLIVTGIEQSAVSDLLRPGSYLLCTDPSRVLKNQKRLLWRS